MRPPTPAAVNAASGVAAKASASASESVDRTVFHLRPIPPFDLDLTVRVLRRHPSNAVDCWDGRAYRRVVVAAGQPHHVKVVQVGGPDHPRLRVAVTGPIPRQAAAEIARDLKRLLGTDCDLTAFYRLAAQDRRLHALAETFRGVKPPRFLSLFETLVSAIACQQVTLALGILLLNRLAQLYGPVFVGRDSPAWAFPRPEDLSNADPEALRAAGFSRQKARAIIDLARTVTGRRCDLEGLAELDDATAVVRLTALRGIGRWTAEYALLRGMGRTQVFPGDDVGARNGLRQWLGLKEPLDYDGVCRALKRWQAYKGLIYFHLLLHRQSRDLRAKPAERNPRDQHSRDGRR